MASLQLVLDRIVEKPAESVGILVGTLLVLRFFAKRAGSSRRYRDFGSGVAVISGASSGIGADFARLSASRGARVVLLARSAGPLAALAAEIQASGGKASWYAVDCGNGAAVAEVATKVLAEHGTPNLLVNCAGAGAWKALWESSPDFILRALDAPLVAASNLTRAFLPAMLTAKDAPPRSSVVMVQSPAG